LAGLLGRFHADYPDITIRLSDPGSREIHELVRSGEIELGLTLFPPRSDDLEFVELVPEEVLLALPPVPADGAARFGVCNVRELDGIRLIVGRSTRHMVEQLLRDAGVTCAAVIAEVDQREAIVPLVLAGVGAALLPGSMAAHAASLGAVLCRLDPPMFRHPIVVHARSVVSPAAAAFLRLVTAGDVPDQRAAAPAYARR
jgi:DNA-binding transcriptional LysR family regulator